MRWQSARSGSAVSAVMSQRGGAPWAAGEAVQSDHVTENGRDLGTAPGTKLMTVSTENDVTNPREACSSMTSGLVSRLRACAGGAAIRGSEQIVHATSMCLRPLMVQIRQTWVTCAAPEKSTPRAA